MTASDITPDRCASVPARAASVEAFPARQASIGSLQIRRALPLRERRLVGPWCFLDRYGPLTFEHGHPMDLAPHPHIGLQTVSWLLEGELLHRDSLGSEALLRPGGVNVMTAGRGIAHSEETPSRNSGRLSGVQLWIAQPESARHSEPAFTPRSDVPVLDLKGGKASVFIGELGDIQSSVPASSPLVGADVEIGEYGSVTLPLQPGFEHALFVLQGRAQTGDDALQPDVLYTLGTGRDELVLVTREGARVLLLGGPPFEETILMWWNFVARSAEEIVAATEAWNAGEKFGIVPGYDGPRIPAPPLRGRVRPPAAS